MSYNNRSPKSNEKEVLNSKKEKITSNTSQDFSIYSKNNQNFYIDQFKNIVKNFISHKQSMKDLESSEIYNSLNSFYLRCQNNVEQYLCDSKNSKGLKLEGSRKYKKCHPSVYIKKFLLRAKKLSINLQNTDLYYYYPKNNYPKLMGEKMKLTPIPSKNIVICKNNEEIKNYQVAKSSAIMMRRLEYTYGLNNKKTFDINQNILFIMKGAILIIEDWWIDILIKRGKRQKEENNNIDKEEIESYNNYSNKKKKIKNIEKDNKDEDLISLFLTQKAKDIALNKNKINLPQKTGNIKNNIKNKNNIGSNINEKEKNNNQILNKHNSMSSISNSKESDKILNKNSAMKNINSCVLMRM